MSASDKVRRSVFLSGLSAAVGALAGALVFALWPWPGEHTSLSNARDPIAGGEAIVPEGDFALGSWGQGRIRAVDNAAGIYALEWRRISDGEDFHGATYQLPDRFKAVVIASIAMGESRRYKYRYEIRNSTKSGQYLSRFVLQTFADSVRPIAQPWDSPGRMSSNIDAFSEGTWLTFLGKSASERIAPGNVAFVEFEADEPPQIVGYKIGGGDQTIDLREVGEDLPFEFDERLPRSTSELWPTGVTIGPGGILSLHSRAARIAYAASELERFAELGWLDGKLIAEYRIALARDGAESVGQIEHKVRKDFVDGRITSEFAALLSFLPPHSHTYPREIFSDALRSGGTGPEMVWIPPGRFAMGCAWSASCTMGDVSERKVEFAVPFGLSTSEVTRDQFANFIEATGYRTEGELGQGCRSYAEGWERDMYRTWRNPGFVQTGAHPVVCVSWDDASAYAHWLAQETGKLYRLPSEAEWEYAARAGSTERWGYEVDQTRLCNEGNAADRTAQDRYPGWRSIANCSDNYVFTAPTRQFRANAFGLYDMYGNVQEWVLDCWHRNFELLPADGSASTDGDCGTRTLRGLSWAEGPRPHMPEIRFSNRETFIPTFHSIYAGFRIAMDTNEYSTGD